MLIKKSTLATIKLIGIITIVLLIVLFLFEFQSYYFPDGNLDNNSLLERLRLDPNYNSTVSINKYNKSNNKEDYVNIFVDTEFKDIFEYLETADTGYETDFMNDDDKTLGCYDNDSLVENIKGVGNTCKTLSNDVKNIYAKDLLHSSGKLYSFAEVCPVTSGQERPIMCLYNKGSHINSINKKMANLIDQIQLNQDNRLDKLNNSVNTHIVDPNRLYNASHVKEYNKYENTLNMGLERRFTNEDQLDDLVMYGNRIKGNLA